jgi:hypothetical protein
VNTALKGHQAQRKQMIGRIPRFPDGLHGMTALPQ